MTALLQSLRKLLSTLQLYLETRQQAPIAPILPQQTPSTPTSTPAPKYRWDTPLNARHSLRLICDEEGLTVEQKNTMSQVIHCESGYNPNIVHPNIVKGVTYSTDYGIAQWNDKYHGSEIPPDVALHNPEAALRLMCHYVKAGLIGQWVCYSKNMYVNYSA